MTVRVGVIGVGTMGQDHVVRLQRRVNGAEVVALADMDHARLEAVAASVPGARTMASGDDLIVADDVGGVVIASWGETHEQYVLSALAAGKPVFCEKPLAPEAEACQRIMDAERAGGRRLLQVGFMRRYDQAYRALFRTLREGALGAPLMIHCAHRNPGVPSFYAGGMPITDSAIHEIDIVRWLLEQEISAAQVLRPRRASRARPDLQDPLLLLLEMCDGTLVDVEVFATATYGYDIRCEVVCESGTVALGDGSRVVVRNGGARSDRVPDNFQERFRDAYDAEFQEWVNGVERGQTGGPSAWDGYAAAVAADAAVASLQSGERVSVSMLARPRFYEPTVAQPVLMNR
jgi:myo-inositol 2-dehydrogenase/D-chiro-inositol 1-dehydrogenase